MKTGGMLQKIKQHNYTMWKFTNLELDIHSKSLGQAAKLSLQYNQPIKLPQQFTAVCQKTSQTLSVLTIQNMSAKFQLSVFLDPDPSGKGIHVIKANDPTQLQFTHNWNGAQLSISNISNEAATAQIGLYGQG